MKAAIELAPRPNAAPLPTAAQLVGPLLGLLAGSAVFCLCSLTSLPQLWYLPIEREWLFGAQPPGLAMAWYGRTLYVMLAGFAVGALSTRFFSTVRARVVRALAWLTLLSFCAAMVVCLAENVDRPTHPIAHPDGESVRCSP